MQMGAGSVVLPSVLFGFSVPRDALLDDLPDLPFDVGRDETEGDRLEETELKPGEVGTAFSSPVGDLVDADEVQPSKIPLIAA